MTDPIKPMGPGPIDAPEILDALEEANDVVEGKHCLSGVQPPVQSAEADPLRTAIDEVAADIRAGALPDEEAATEAVLIRLVNLRYGFLPEAKRQGMLLHLHGIMHSDPVFQARIERLLALAAPKAE